MLKKMRRRLWGERQRWADYPVAIQIDTNNHCGRKYCGIRCIACYPQWAIDMGYNEFAVMPLHEIEWIMNQTAWYSKSHQKKGVPPLMALFLNGDGLTEPRLPEIAHMSKRKIPWWKTQTFTNGILTENLHYLLSDHLDEVCFTISGHTKELYRKTHGGDHFEDVIRTLNRYVYEKSSKQSAEIHLVLSKANHAYAKEWWDFFEPYEKRHGVKRVISALVASPDNVPSQAALGDLSLKDQERLIMNVAGMDNRMWISGVIPNQKPCVLWDNLSFSLYKKGDVQKTYIVQCCNWSDYTRFNYGTVEEAMNEGRSLKDIWAERLSNRMRNRICRNCNMKHPQWEKRLNAMKLEVSV